MSVSVEPLRVSEEVELAPEHDLDEQLESDAESITGERQNECNVCGWKKFRRYFRHPYLRIFIAVGICGLNFLIYAEDPVAHSRVKADIPIIGHGLSLLFNKYQKDDSAAYAAKVIIAILSLLLGMVFGHQVIHRRLLRDHWKLEMFHGKYGSNGSWMVMFWTTLLFLGIGAGVYNVVVVMIDEKYDDPAVLLDGTFGMSNENFMKLAASGTWLGDYITAYMVIDMILQDTYYHKFAPKARASYRGSLRIVLFWFLTPTLCALVIGFIVSDMIDWEEYGNDFTSTSELTRGLLAGVITLWDLMIVMQDWEFPEFTTNQDINLPGLATFEINWRMCEGIAEFFIISITGKWFNYGIIFLVMCLDLNMLKNQVVYDLVSYGQYALDDGRICSITDSSDLYYFQQDPTRPEFQAENRVAQRASGSDICMNSRYEGYSAFAKTICAVPAMLGGLLFLVLIKMEKPKRKEGRELIGTSELANMDAASQREVIRNTSVEAEDLELAPRQESDD